MGLPLVGPVAAHACAAIPDQEKGRARCRCWVGSLELVGLSAKACPSEDQSVVSKALVLRLWI